MRIKDLTLKSFRNFSQISMSFSERLNVFVGENGQGKTNLLEGLHFSLIGDSFRYGDLNTLIQNQSVENLGEKPTAAQIKINVESENGLNFDIRCNLESKKKNFFVNGKAISNSKLKQKFKVVLFSPESLAVIKEGASLRRDLIDDLIQSIFINGTNILQRYRKILRARNKILSDYLQTAHKSHLEVLESLQPLFIQSAVELTLMRTQAIREIQNSFANVVSGILKDQALKPEIQYFISDEMVLGFTSEQIKEKLVGRQLELRGAEFQAGTSLVGPHKHDIRFLYGENDSRFFCSQGQQRALILAFKMAQIVYHRKVHGEYPVLMLDDVLSELDQQKQQSLVQFLRENSAQTFITTTDFNLSESFSEELTSVFRIKEGKLCPTNL